MSRKEYNPFADAPVYNKQIKSGGSSHSSNTSAHMGGSRLKTATGLSKSKSKGNLASSLSSTVDRRRSR